MKGVVQFLGLLLIAGFVHAQAVPKQLAEAVRSLVDDDQMRYGLVGFYVVDNKTGAVVYDKNGKVGLATASTQKVITSTAALELLGTNYTYKTQLGYTGTIKNGLLSGDLYLVGSGDPSLGSWRYDNAKEQVVLNKWINAIKQAGIKQIQGTVIAYDNKFESQTVPGGWIWDDIGNYYGAGVSGLNWRENQYDLKLKSGSAGDAANIITTIPKLYNISLISELRAGKAGSGDNAYIYLPPYANTGYVRGTIPPSQAAFTISGSFPDPAAQLSALFIDELSKQGITLENKSSQRKTSALPQLTVLNTHISPTLDSINNWFLKKSINLYGEAFVKTLGLEKQNQGTADAGLAVIKAFWKERGIDVLSIRMIDGSGLSPQNRLTPEALVKVMQYAKSRSWFNAFYNALPEYNGLKMKSGTIGGVKSFTGYAGDYTFAIIVNNYNGSAAEVTRKMYRILDYLK